MQPSRSLVCLVSALLSALCVACESRVSLGARCGSVTDCVEGLVCGVDARCRDECTTSVDCADGRCLRDPATGRLGCSLETDVCVEGGCPDGLRCVAGECLGTCALGTDCPDGTCSDDGVCVPPRCTLDVDVGRFVACAIDCDHEVHCWGGWDSVSSRLTSSPDDCGGTPCLLRPIAIELPAGVVAERVTVGAQRACVLARSGEVWCWGLLVEDPVEAPTRIVRGGGAPLLASDVRAGGSHVCAREREDASRVACWGYNLHGQLGSGGTSSSTSALTSFTDVTILAPGEWRTQVVRSDGAIVGAGENDDAEIAAPAAAEVVDPTAGPAVAGTVVGLAPVVDGTCALLDDGALSCWGRVTTLLGRDTPPGTVPCGDNACTAEPVDVLRDLVPRGPFGGVVGDRFAPLVLAWTPDGQLYGVGAAGGGVLGEGTDTFELAGTTALAGRAAHRFAVGAESACAILDETSELVCWGANDVGQLGRGATSARELIAAPPVW